MSAAVRVTPTQWGSCIATTQTHAQECEEQCQGGELFGDRFGSPFAGGGSFVGKGANATGDAGEGVAQGLHPAGGAGHAALTTGSHVGPSGQREVVALEALACAPVVGHHKVRHGSLAAVDTGAAAKLGSGSYGAVFTTRSIWHAVGANWAGGAEGAVGLRRCRARATFDAGGGVGALAQLESVTHVAHAAVSLLAGHLPGATHGALCAACWRRRIAGAINAVLFVQGRAAQGSAGQSRAGEEWVCVGGFLGRSKMHTELGVQRTVAAALAKRPLGQRVHLFSPFTGWT